MKINELKELIKRNNWNKQNKEKKENSNHGGSVPNWRLVFGNSGPLNSWPRLTLGLAYTCVDCSISWSLNPGPWLSAVGRVDGLMLWMHDGR